MYVLDQAAPAATPIPGIAHSTWAGQAEGLEQLSVWRQTLAPGGASPPHRHDCDEVVLCQSGRGEVHIDGQAHRFGADTTVVLPKGIVHQIFNTGTQPLEIIGVLASSPVACYLPDGQVIDLPWRT